jgi:hypothetical protein
LLATQRHCRRDRRMVYFTRASRGRTQADGTADEWFAGHCRRGAFHEFLHHHLLQCSAPRLGGSGGERVFRSGPMGRPRNDSAGGKQASAGSAQRTGHCLDQRGIVRLAGRDDAGFTRPLAPKNQTGAKVNCGRAGAMCSVRDFHRGMPGEALENGVRAQATLTERWLNRFGPAAQTALPRKEQVCIFSCP